MPIYQNQTNNVVSETISLPSGQSKQYKIAAGKSETTLHILTNSDLTKINDFPRFNPIYQLDAITSTGPGDNKTVTINLKAAEVSIFNSSEANVLAYLGLLTNYPALPCHPSTERIIKLESNVEQIIFVFDAAGTIYVEQRD